MKILTSCFAIALCVLAVTSPSKALEPNAAVAPRPSSPIKKIEIGEAPTRGPENAQITIIEFADFECPYCARLSLTLDKLMKMYPDQIRLVFKNYPLRNHRRAPLAHEAALAAQAQGKFWEMHDLLYANPSRLRYDDLLAYAGQLQLDIAAFTDTLENRKLRGRVLADINEGRSLEIGATPTFFVNGRRLVGAQSFFDLRELIERELANGRSTRSP